MATSLMQRAKAQKGAGANFTPQDPRKFVPPEQHDAVDRVVAAGIRLMYSPPMAEERQQAIQSQDPVPKKIADNVTGLLLTLDQRAKGGIPQQVIFPAAVILTNEAANLLVHASQSVTQDDYNESLQILYVQLGKKLGASDDQLMQGAQDALAKGNGGMAPEEQTAVTGEPVAPDATGAQMPATAGMAGAAAGPPAPMPSPQGAMP